MAKRVIPTETGACPCFVLLLFFFIFSVSVNGTCKCNLAPVVAWRHINVLERQPEE